VLATSQFIATFCSAIFAGAALYINLVEHPVRLKLDTAVATAQWAWSYQRATLMQAPLAIAATLAALGAWLLDAGVVWLAAAILIGAVVPFTFLGIMPTNKKLLAPGRDRVSPETRMLLEKWGLLHGVRSALSVFATVLMLWGLRGA
jgi:hypothetical protein